MDRILSPTDPRVAEYGYAEARDVPGKGTCAIQPFLTTTGLVVGLSEVGYEFRYCYEHSKDARDALRTWDGQGDPSGPWIKQKGLGVDRLGPGAIGSAWAPAREAEERKAEAASVSSFSSGLSASKKSRTRKGP
jgi:hypothetical protein